MQTLPSIFIKKIEIDKTLKSLKGNVVIPMDAAFAAVRLQRSLRRMCQISLAMAKVDPDGSGSPVAMVA